MEPEFQFLQSGDDFGLAFGGTPGLCVGISHRPGAFLLLSLFFSGLLRTLGASRKPFRHPVWRRFLAESIRLAIQQQKKPQSVFAWELAAGASTVEGRLAQINLCLIREFGAALAFAPGGLLVVTEGQPFARGRQVFPSFGGAGVRRQRQDLLSCPGHRHRRAPKKVEIMKCRIIKAEDIKNAAYNWYTALLTA